MSTSAESHYWRLSRSGPERHDIDARQQRLADSMQIAMQSTHPGERFDTVAALRDANYRSQILKEYVFEEIRAREFPKRPSRWECLFVFDRDLDPRAYAARLGIGPRALLVLTPVGTRTKILRTRMSLLNCQDLPYAGIAARARDYWKGLPASGEMDSEVLLVGSCRVEKIIGPLEQAKAPDT